MATKYAVASGNWGDTSTWSDSDGGAPGATIPADGDTVILCAGFSVLMNVDQSAWTGLAGNNIVRGGASPAMLYFKDGTDGYLKLRTGANLSGTYSTNRGRLLANSDGVWGNTGALSASNRAVIDCIGSATLVLTNLECRLYCAQPTNKYVTTYATKYDFNAATAVNTTDNTIDLGTTPPTAGTVVRVKALAGATLPAPLNEYDMYYTYSISGNTCKLCYVTNTSAAVVDLTAVGSGTCTLYTGHSNTGTGVMNVFEDVSADAFWTTTAGQNYATLVDVAPLAMDVQFSTFSGITSSTITLGNNVDSAQYPGARIFVSNRNVSIRTNGASSVTLLNASAINYAGNVYNAEILNYGTQQSTAINNSNYACTMDGSIRNFSSGIVSAAPAFGGVISGCSSHGLQSPAATSSIGGIIAGCLNATYMGTGYTITANCQILGCTRGVYTSSCPIIASGAKIFGCQYGLHTNYDMRAVCDIYGTDYGVYGCTGGYFDGIVSGGSAGYYGNYGTIASGTLRGNSTAGVTCTIMPEILQGLTIQQCTVGVQVTASSCFRAVDLVFSGNGIDISTYGSVYSKYYQIFNYAGTANDTRAATGGGSMTHETSTVPVGKTYAHKFTYTYTYSPNYFEWVIERPTNGTISIPVYAKHDATSLTEAQRIHWVLVDPANDPWSNPANSYLDSFIAIDSTDWQTDTLTYTKTDDRPLILRVFAHRGSGNAYVYSDIMSGAAPPAGSGGSYGY